MFVTIVLQGIRRVNTVALCVSPQIRVPHLRDGLIVAKVGIARGAAAPAHDDFTDDVCTITPGLLLLIAWGKSKDGQERFASRMPTLGAKDAPKMGHPVWVVLPMTYLRGPAAITLL